MEPSAKSAYSTPGKPFTRDTNYINDRIVADPQAHRDAAKYEYNTIGTLTTGLTKDAEAWPVEADRYRLVAARACPWANRTIIVRRLLGLEDVISLGTPGPDGQHLCVSWCHVATGALPANADVTGVTHHTGTTRCSTLSHAPGCR